MRRQSAAGTHASVFLHPPSRASLTPHGRALRDAWRGYWRCRAERATVSILHALDDRALKDIGIHRCEIESVVYGGRGDRVVAPTALAASAGRDQFPPTRPAACQ